MIEITRLCSGRPGTPALEHGAEVPCHNEVDVELVRGASWRRPLCVECAIAFEAHCAAGGLPRPEFLEARAA